MREVAAGLAERTFKPEALVFREDPSTLFAANVSKISGGFGGRDPSSAP